MAQKLRLEQAESPFTWPWKSNYRINKDIRFFKRWCKQHNGMCSFLDSSSYLVVSNQIITPSFLPNTLMSSGLSTRSSDDSFHYISVCVKKTKIENGACDTRQQMWCVKKGEHQHVACFGGLLATTQLTLGITVFNRKSCVITYILPKKADKLMETSKLFQL